MRLRSVSNAVVTLATAGSLINASPAPHQHGHVHVDKRNVEVVDVPGPTVVAYELNGKLIDQSEVCEGIQSGTLKWADGSDTPPECSEGIMSVSKPLETLSASMAATTSVTAAVTSDHVPVASSLPEVEKPNGLEEEAVKASSTLTANVLSTIASTSSKALPSYTQSSPSTSSSVLDGQGLDKEFPDSELDCTVFPSAYGPLNVEWAGLGGWSGIQYITIEGDLVTHIDTAVPGGEGCKPGAMCSYACPAGYQKSQWPSQQGATGQSVGGLSCNSNGKLALTNPGLSKNLCIKGTGAVTVQNKLSNNAAICRTDYPGLCRAFTI